MRETFGTRRIQDSNQEEVPEWLRVMYNTVYFEACTIHRHEKKDQFCIDCSISLCSNCLPIHYHLFNPPHKIVKIRRYVYCEVIKRQDLSKHFNCSGIQAYQTNKSKVIFLKQRTQQQQPQQHNNNISSNNNNSCIICQRSLPEPLSLYCSIACKVFAKEETIQVKDKGLNNSNEGSRVSSLKRQRSRKGVPLRAPMF